MVIEVRLDLNLQKYFLIDSYGVFAVDVQDEITLLELLDELEFKADAVKLAMVNGVVSDMSCVLSDGDKVSLFSQK